jgi:hypothetical protein
MIEFGAVAPGVYHRFVTYQVVQDASVTARIDDGDGYFRVTYVLRRRVVQTPHVPYPYGPDEERHLPDNIGDGLDAEDVLTSDGVTPLEVPAGYEIQVDVQFLAEDDGAFNMHSATLQIFGLSPEPIVVPIAGTVGELRLEVPNPHIRVPQTREAVVPISIHSVAGAGTEVQIALEPHPDITMSPVQVIVQRGGVVQANLRFAVPNYSPAVTHSCRVVMSAFGGSWAHTTFFSVQIVAGPPPGTPLTSRIYCNVRDNPATINPLAWGHTDGRWRTGTLAVFINTAGCNFDSQGTSITPEEVIRQAFRKWEIACPFLSFVFVDREDAANIHVRFGGRELYEEFGAPEGVAGAASPPEHGDVMFDSAELWQNGWDRSDTRVNLMAIAVHEIGHALGLNHASGIGGTMTPEAGFDGVDSESRMAINLLYGWKPQQQLPDRATSDRPALAVTHFANFTGSQSTPRMVWKGSREDTALYEADFVGGRWTPQRQIPGFHSSHSPGLTELHVTGGAPYTGLLMAWKAPGDNQGIWWSRDIGRGWEVALNIREIGSSTRPALTNADGQIVMAWKGVRSDQAIYFSLYDGNAGWSPQRRAGVVGTSDSPALVAVGRRVFMFWKGIAGDNTAFFSILDLNDPHLNWSPQQRITFSVFETREVREIAIGTTGALTACRRGEDILLAWKGAQGDQGIYFTLLVGESVLGQIRETFQGQINVAGVGTSVGPAVTNLAGGTLMAWKGIEGDNTIFFSTLNIV